MTEQLARLIQVLLRRYNSFFPEPQLGEWGGVDFNRDEDWLRKKVELEDKFLHDPPIIDGEVLYNNEAESEKDLFEFHFHSGQILNFEKSKELSFEYLDNLLKDVEQKRGPFNFLLSSWLKIILAEKI